MIRRELNTEPGNPRWLLISQLEHARLSGALAEQWGKAPFLALVRADQLLPAIYLHDDGWRAWEQTPEVDPQTGRPRGFTEMPLDESLVIWTRSIQRAASLGPLAAWAVAGHFATLLTHAEEATQPEAQAWLADCQQQRQTWLNLWRHLPPDSSASQAAAPSAERSAAQIAVSNSEQSLERAELALAQLRLFDWLSLWLCLAERNSPREFDIPGGPKLTFTPQARQPGEQRQTILVQPWPLKTSELTLDVTGRLVPVKHYTSDQDLAAIPAAQHTLRWKLCHA